MKKLKIKFKKLIENTIELNSSKSESNRLLIIKAISKKKIIINNLSNANDTIILKNLIVKNSKKIWDAEDAGTTMRFLTSYLALVKEDVIITGTIRMKKRPIKILVDALNKIGSKIYYTDEIGYPPLKIDKKINQKNNTISIRGDISSQYISSLLMIGPKLKNGLNIIIEEPFYSEPYVLMTLNLMKKFGISSLINGNKIIINNQEYRNGSYTVEADWSAASYWYAIVSINKNINKIKLKGLRKNSFQGDSVLSTMMVSFGVDTEFLEDGIIIKKNNNIKNYLKIDFKNFPDLTQSILVVAAYHKIKLEISGVESLKIKETDRLSAMKKELEKIGCNFYNKKESWILEKRVNSFPKLVVIDTYKDHRMAMAFVCISSEMEMYIKEPSVVNKSYPNFWNDLAKVGYETT